MIQKWATGGFTFAPVLPLDDHEKGDEDREFKHMRFFFLSLEVQLKLLASNSSERHLLY
jgi:hypothetical protein